MNDLFIAPEGAMQFEVTEGPGGVSCSIPAWVGAPIPFKLTKSNPRPSCGCKTGFPILHLIEPDHPLLRLSNWNNGLRHKKPVMVCTCHGRIIE